MGANPRHTRARTCAPPEALRGAIAGRSKGESRRRFALPLDHSSSPRPGGSRLRLIAGLRRARSGWSVGVSSSRSRASASVFERWASLSDRSSASRRS